MASKILICTVSISEPGAPNLEQIHAKNETVAEEDFRICEAVEGNLESGVYSESF